MFDLPQPFGPTMAVTPASKRSEEHTSELQSQSNLVCRLLLEKKKQPLHAAPPPKSIHRRISLPLTHRKRTPVRRLTRTQHVPSRTRTQRQAATQYRFTTYVRL